MFVSRAILFPNTNPCHAQQRTRKVWSSSTCVGRRPCQSTRFCVTLTSRPLNFGVLSALTATPLLSGVGALPPNIVENLTLEPDLSLLVRTLLLVSVLDSLLSLMEWTFSLVSCNIGTALLVLAMDVRIGRHLPDFHSNLRSLHSSHLGQNHQAWLLPP